LLKTDFKKEAILKVGIMHLILHISVLFTTEAYCVLTHHQP